MLVLLLECFYVYHRAIIILPKNSLTTFLGRKLYQVGTQCDTFFNIFKFSQRVEKFPKKYEKTGKLTLYMHMILIKKNFVYLS